MLNPLANFKEIRYACHATDGHFDVEAVQTYGTTAELV
jgi:hypothetical protein